MLDINRFASYFAHLSTRRRTLRWIHFEVHIPGDDWIRLQLQATVSFKTKPKSPFFHSFPCPPFAHHNQCACHTRGSRYGNEIFHRCSRQKGSHASQGTSDRKKGHTTGTQLGRRLGFPRPWFRPFLGRAAWKSSGEQQQRRKRHRETSQDGWMACKTVSVGSWV